MNIISEELIRRTANILGVSADDIEDMTFSQIIESLVNECESSAVESRDDDFSDFNYNYMMRNILWKQHCHEAIVSYRTFARRLKNGMSPLEAATKERGKSTGRPRKGSKK